MKLLSLYLYNQLSHLQINPSSFRVFHKEYYKSIISEHEKNQNSLIFKNNFKNVDNGSLDYLINAIKYNNQLTEFIYEVISVLYKNSEERNKVRCAFFNEKIKIEEEGRVHNNEYDEYIQSPIIECDIDWNDHTKVNEIVLILGGFLSSQNTIMNERILSDYFIVSELESQKDGFLLIAWAKSIYQNEFSGNYFENKDDDEVKQIKELIHTTINIYFQKLNIDKLFFDETLKEIINNKLLAIKELINHKDMVCLNFIIEEPITKKTYSVEVFHSEQGWKQERFIRDFESEKEAMEFDKYNKDNEGNHEEYYKSNYLGLKTENKNGYVVYEYPEMYKNIIM